MFAFSREMKEKLGKLFEQKKIKREYVAVVHGMMEKEKGSWKAKLFEGLDKKMRVDSRGKDALTHYSS